jgi:hypothetical protein
VGGSIAVVLATGQGHKEEVSTAALLALAGQGHRRVSDGLCDVDCKRDGDIVNRVMAEAAIAVTGAGGDAVAVTGAGGDG